MRICLFLVFLGMFFIATTFQGSSGLLLAQNSSEGRYEVLSPWAEVDSLPLQGISPRVKTLAGKKIGLFANFKRAAPPIATSIEKRLKSMYPDCETSLYHSVQPNVTEIETKNRDKFTAWVKGQDAIIAVVGD